MKVDEDGPVIRKKPTPKAPTKAAFSAKRAMECRVCSNDHSMFTCPKFVDMTVTARHQWAEDCGVCFNCLSPSHLVDKCTSSNRCKVCHQPHHTLLHQASASSTKPEASACAVTQLSKNIRHAHSNYTVPFMATIRVKAKGLTQQCRAHLDTGASVTLITHNLAKRLKAPRIPHSTTRITGVTSSFNTLYQVKLSLLGTPKLG